MSETEFKLKRRDPCPFCGLSHARLEQLEAENAELKQTLGPNPTAEEIIARFMKQHGYTALYNLDCHCATFECDSELSMCRAGYTQPDGSVGPEKEDWAE